MAFSIIAILFLSSKSTLAISSSKFEDERYAHIILDVDSFGSNSKLEIVLWDKWKSKIDFSEILLSVLSE